MPDLFDLLDAEGAGEEAPPAAKEAPPAPATAELQQMAARGVGEPCGRSWTGAPQDRCSVGGGDGGLGIGSKSYCSVHVPVGFYPHEREVIPR